MRDVRVALVGLIFFALAATARADTWGAGRSGRPGSARAAGKRAVARFVNDMIERLARGELKTYRAFRRPYDAGIDRIETQYDEASDTAVRDAIADALYVPAARAGLDAETLFDG